MYGVHGAGRAAKARCSVANIDTFHADQGMTDWSNFTTPEKQQAIVRASSYIDKRFGRRFLGVRSPSLEPQGSGSANRIAPAIVLLMW